MFDLVLISNKKVTGKQLEEIITLKSNVWPYSFNSQLDWINDNLKDTDIHVLLSLNGKLVGYLNLIDIEIKIDGNLYYGCGIGNVCTMEHGKGWGKEIMTQTNLYIKERKKIGLLFCKESLVNFYKLYNWELIEKEKLSLLFNFGSIETMIFNWNGQLTDLEYLGKLF